MKAEHSEWKEALCKVVGAGDPEGSPKSWLPTLLAREMNTQTTGDGLGFLWCKGPCCCFYGPKNMFPVGANIHQATGGLFLFSSRMPSTQRCLIAMHTKGAQYTSLRKRHRKKELKTPNSRPVCFRETQSSAGFGERWVWPPMERLRRNSKRHRVCLVD